MGLAAARRVAMTGERTCRFTIVCRLAVPWRRDPAKVASGTCAVSVPPHGQCPGGAGQGRAAGGYSDQPPARPR